MPMTDTTSSRHTGPVRRRTSRPTTKARQRSIVQRLGARANRLVEDEAHDQIHEKEHADDAPDPGQTRHDRPAPEQPAADPRDEAFERSAERRGADDDVLAAGHEVRRAVEAASHDDEIPADPGARRDAGAAAADDDERAVDGRGAREPCLAEHDDDVAVDVALDRRRAGDDHDLTDRGAGIRGCSPDRCEGARGPAVAARPARRRRPRRAARVGPRGRGAARPGAAEPQPAGPSRAHTAGHRWSTGFASWSLGPSKTNHLPEIQCGRAWRHRGVAGNKTRKPEESFSRRVIGLDSRTGQSRSKRPSRGMMVWLEH